jgi:succinoglycan biosynthesis protein ExoA
VTALPLVSVVIPVRNEARHLGACLDAVLAQDYPPERLEVIVVDGDSDDGTAELVAGYQRRDARIRRAQNARRIVPTAMNIGIRLARGSVIARVDGHTTIAPDYVRVGVETLRRTGADNVGGPMCAVGGGWFGDAVARATSSRFGVGSYFHYGWEEREVDTVYLGMWPRAAFERIGLFDEDLVRNQDDEINYRLRKTGGRIVMNPAMRSSYQNRQSIARLARQYFQYGLWKVRVLQKHPLQMSWRHFVPPAFVAVLTGLAVASSWMPAARLGAAALGCVYGAAVLVVSLPGARGVGGWLAAALAFVTIHTSWGVGFLCGLARFASRWTAPELPPRRLAARGNAVLRSVSGERGSTDSA